MADIIGSKDALQVAPFVLDNNPKVNNVGNQVKVCFPLADSALDRTGIFGGTNTLKSENVVFKLLPHIFDGGNNLTPYLIASFVGCKYELSGFPNGVNLGNRFLILRLLFCLFANLLHLVLVVLEFELKHF